MNINLLKKLPVAVACLSSVAAFAGMDMDSRVSQLEAQMKQVRTSTENKNFGAKTAFGGAMLDESYGFNFGIGAVYQTLQLGNTEYAYTFPEDTSTLEYPMDGVLKESNFNWAWGINAMVGYNSEHDGFDVRLVNSYYDTSASNTYTGDNSNCAVALRANPGISYDCLSDTAFIFGTAKSRWSVTYDLLGLELGRNFYVSQYLSFRPFIGLQASWIWMNNDISYLDLDNNDNDYNVAVNDYSNWFGMGPQVGVNAEFGLGGGFSIFADTKGALMYGRYKVTHSQEFDYIGGQPSSPYDIDLDAWTHKMMPYVLNNIGISYEFYTDNNKNHFNLRAGYTTQYFFGANRMLRSQAVYDDGTDVDGYYYPQYVRQEGELSTQGLMLDATWTF